MKRKLISRIFCLVLTLATLVTGIVLVASAEGGTATLTFDSKDKRTSYSANQQVWEENGITFTNDKASGSDIADYAKPVRLYAKSSITIEFANPMTKIEVTCNTTAYANALKNSAGANATVSGKVVTIDLSSAPSTSYTIASLTAQTRFDSLTVHYEGSAAPQCQHENTKTVETEPTKTEPGYRITTCLDCGDETERVQIADALGFAVSFAVPVGAIPPENLNGVTVTLPDGVDAPASFGDHEYSFVGWTTASVTDATETPTLYKAGDKVTLTDDTVFYALYSYGVEGGSSAAGFTEKSISEISSTDVVVITMTTKNGTVYALTNGGGTSKAPAGTIITVNGTAISSNITDNLKWNISNSSGNLTIYPNGVTDKWLYCTATNNGVRVGDNANKIFTIDATSGYLKHTATNRYVGVYTTTPDWRCYTNTTGNTANQTLRFYVESSGTSTVAHYTTLGSSVSTDSFDASFVVPAGSQAPGMISGLRVTLPQGPALSSTLDLYSYVFVGWSTQQINETTAPSNIYKAGDSVILEDDTTFYAVYSYIKNAAEHITDASVLKAGDKLIIVSPTKGKIAGSIAEGKDFLSELNIAISLLGRVYAIPDGALILTLGGTDGAWTLANADGQLLGATAVKELAFGSGTTTWSFVTEGENNTLTLVNTDGGRIIHNANATRFTTYTSATNAAMLLPAIYRLGQEYYTTSPKANPCTHSDTHIELLKDSTCSEIGSGVRVCSDCGKEIEAVEIAVKDHSFSEPTCTDPSTCSFCGAEGAEALGHSYEDTVTPPTCQSEGYTTYVCSTCGDTYEDDETAVIDHNYVNDVCDMCGATDPTSIDYSGVYYIAGKRLSDEFYQYIKAELNGTRYAILDSALTELPTSIISPDYSLVFVVEKCNDGSNTHVIYVKNISGEAKYLGWDSEADNLNNGTFVTRDNAMKVVITMNDDGTFNIYNTESERYLAFNSDSNNDFAAWYKSGQTKNLHLIPVEEAEITHTNLNIGSNLTMKYHVTLPEGASIEGYSIRFTLKTTTVTVTEYEVVNGRYVFAFSGIAPQCMGDNITAELMCGDAVVGAHSNYSIKIYASNLLDKAETSAECKMLLSDVLRYGAAAQAYLNYKTDDLVTEGVENLVAVNASVIPNATIDNIREIVYHTEKNSALTFSAAGVRFDFDNKTYVKITAESLDGVTVRVNGVAAEILPSDDGRYIVYSDSISSLGFGNEVVFELYSGDNLLETLTYSINSYVCSKYDKENAMADLALALYRYGKSTEEYKY